MSRIVVACMLVLAAGCASAEATQSRKLSSSITINLPFLKGKGAAGSGSSSGSSGETSTAAARVQQQPTNEPPRAEPPLPRNGKLVAGGAWQVAATPLAFQPLQNVRVLSPLCATGLEATSCGGFSGNTAVVLSSVMPALGTSTNVKTTQCFCDFRNTLNGFLPANSVEVYRCVVYCQ